MYRRFPVPVFVKLLSTSDGHVEITGSRTVADPHADRGEEGDAQPEQEEELQVEVSVYVRNRPGRHDDKRGPQVLNSLQEIRKIILHGADPPPLPLHCSGFFLTFQELDHATNLKPNNRKIRVNWQNCKYFNPKNCYQAHRLDLETSGNVKNSEENVTKYRSSCGTPIWRCTTVPAWDRKLCPAGTLEWWALRWARARRPGGCRRGPARILPRRESALQPPLSLQWIHPSSKKTK